MNTLTKSKKEKAFIEPRRARDYVILLDDLEFAMSKEQLWEITNLHNDGMKLEDISEHVQRDKYEVLIALIHQAKKGTVKLRPFARRL